MQAHIQWYLNYYIYYYLIKESLDHLFFFPLSVGLSVVKVNTFMSELFPHFPHIALVKVLFFSNPKVLIFFLFLHENIFCGTH